MKIIVNESSEFGEPEITVNCGRIDRQIEEIITFLRLTNDTIVGKNGSTTRIIPFSEIFYFDVADRRAFIYTEKEVWEAPVKLWQIEEKIAGTWFIRASKNTIVNIMKIDFVDSTVTGNFIATLLNGEKVVISRTYVPLLKQKLGI